MSANLQLCSSSCSVLNRDVPDFSLPSHAHPIHQWEFIWRLFLQNIHPESPTSQKPFSHHCCLVQTIISPLDWVILSLLLTLSSSFLSTTQQLGDPFEMSDQANSAPNTTKPSSYSVKTKVKVSDNFLNLSPITLFLAHSLWQTGFSRDRLWRQSWCPCYSVAKSYLTFCDPLNCSMPGFPDLHISQSLLRLMSVELVKLFNHLICWSGYLLGFNTLWKEVSWSRMGKRERRKREKFNCEAAQQSCGQSFKELGRIHGLLEVPLLKPN